MTDATVILCDNQRGIHLSENPMFHDRSKQVTLFLGHGTTRRCKAHIGIDELVADILTKPLGKVKFLTFHENRGIVERPYSEGLVG